MTTTTQRRRPAARKTRVGDEAASLPVAEAVTDAVTDAGNEAATEAAARTEPGEAAEAVTPTVPTEPATRLEQFLDLGGKEKQGHAARGKVAEDLVDFRFGRRIDAAQWIVEHHHLRIHREPSRKQDLLLVSPR